MTDDAAAPSLLLRVRGRLCALPLEHVVETMRPQPVSAVADAPPSSRASLIIRGAAVPVVDVARLLNPSARRAAASAAARRGALRHREESPIAPSRSPSTPWSVSAGCPRARSTSCRRCCATPARRRSRRSVRWTPSFSWSCAPRASSRARPLAEPARGGRRDEPRRDRPDRVDRLRAVVARGLGLAFDDTKSSFLEEVLARRRAARGRGTSRRTSRSSRPSHRPSCARSPRSSPSARRTSSATSISSAPSPRWPCPTACGRALGARRLRILSAGCASGEEPYSLAMLAREHVTDPAWDVSILAVDVNPRASSGRPGPASRRGRSARRRRRSSDRGSAPRGASSSLADAVRERGALRGAQPGRRRSAPLGGRGVRRRLLPQRAHVPHARERSRGRRAHRSRALARWIPLPRARRDAARALGRLPPLPHARDVLLPATRSLRSSGRPRRRGRRARAPVAALTGRRRGHVGRAHPARLRAHRGDHRPEVRGRSCRPFGRPRATGPRARPASARRGAVRRCARERAGALPSGVAWDPDVLLLARPYC